MGTRGHEAEQWDELAAKGIDIGHDIVILFYRNGNDEKAGVLLYHRHADGAVCGGSVPFDVPANARQKDHGRRVWRVISLDPLELTPSIRDKDCVEGLHGFVINGRWVPC